MKLSIRLLTIVSPYLSLCLTMLYGSIASAGLAGGTNATPTAYEVTVVAIDFVKSDGSVFNFFTGNQVIDIASVNANQAAAAIGAGVSIPAGTYTQMRVTISGNFGMTGTAVVAGIAQPCRTGPGGANVNLGAVTASAAFADGGVAAKQTVSIPTGAGVNLAGTGLTNLGNGNYRFTTAQNFAIPEGQEILPAYTVKFDVTNAMEFVNNGGACAVVPQPPTVTVS